MSFVEGEITVEFGGTVGPAGPAGNAVPIAAGTVLANPSGVLANPVGVDAAGMRTLLSSVGYVSQTLTDGQKHQARENLAAVGYVSQTLTVAQQVQARTNIGLAATAPALCVIAVGESNSGGYASNASAFGWELASRPELQMLNTSTLLFENLDIGTNNNLNHGGLNSTTHGWELELANACKRNEIGRQVYYVQTGQGGSRTIEWTTASGYDAFNTSFLPRVNATKSLMAFRPVQYVVWLSLGINDAIDGLDSYVYKGRMRQLIASIKREIPDVKFCVGRIMRTNAAYQAIDDRIIELADDTSVRVVSVTGLTTDGGNHWDYQGMRGMSERMLDATRQMVSIPGRPLTFTSSTGSTDGSKVTFTALGQHARATEIIDFSFDQSIEIDWLADMTGLVVALDTDVSEFLWADGPVETFLLATFQNSYDFYISEANGSVAGTAFSVTGISRLRFRKSGSNLLLESTTDNSTWTTRHTRTGVLSGVNYVRIKMLSAIGGASVRVFLPRS